MIDKVSVVLPVYNREERVNKSLNSVLNQTYKNLQVIVVDDGSNDDTYDVLNKVKDRRVKIVRLKDNKGVSKARNIGIEISEGKFVAFIDSDDIWNSCKIEKQINYIKKCKKRVALVDCGWKAVGGKNAVPRIENKKERTSTKKLLSFKNVCSPPTVVARRSVLEEMGGFDENLQTVEDVDLWVRISKKYEIEHLTEVLVEVNRGGHKRLGNEYRKFINGHLRFYAKHKEKYEKLSDKEHARFFIRVARRLLSMRKMVRARRFLGKAIILNPYNVKLHLIMASTLLGEEAFSVMSEARHFIKKYVNYVK